MLPRAARDVGGQRRTPPGEAEEDERGAIQPDEIPVAEAAEPVTERPARGYW
ncbi:MAG: hypothetical protein K1X87_12560 [Dehalococcoidia bacterium]|nr:hypothetical protein [Dehalococcoidia bacterium]